MAGFKMKQQIKNEEEEKLLPDVPVVEQCAFERGTALLLCRPVRDLGLGV